MWFGNAYEREQRAPLTLRVQQYIGCHFGPEGLEQFLDFYDISRSYKIGYGKHSDVIAAQSKRSGMERAVKVLSLNDIGRTKIHKEVCAMHIFSHQRCSQMKDVLICGQQLPNVRASPPYVCIVMDHIRDAETLTQIVMRGGDPQLAVTICAQIGSALAEMHSKRLLHKDLWPENILIDKDRKAFLIDFGCSESMDTNTAGPNNDVNIPYASPEMCERLPASPCDDNWALGLVLTETITGKAVSHRMNRQHGKPLFFHPSLLEEAIAETCAKGGPVMGQICRQLLDMDASRRATAQQVASAAQLGQGPLQAGPTSPARQAVALAPQLGQLPLQAGPATAAQQAVPLAPQLGQFSLQARQASAAQKAVPVAPQLGQFSLQAGPASAAQQAVPLATQLGQFSLQAGPASAAQQGVPSAAKQVWSPSLTSSANHTSQPLTYQANSPLVNSGLSSPPVSVYPGTSSLAVPRTEQSLGFPQTGSVTHVMGGPPTTSSLDGLRTSTYLGTSSPISQVGGSMSLPHTSTYLGISTPIRPFGGSVSPPRAYP